MEVTLWDKNSGPDDLIGSHKKDLRSELDDSGNKLDESSSWAQRAHWLDLADAKGKQAGRIQVALEWHGTSLPGAAGHESEVCLQLRNISLGCEK